MTRLGVVSWYLEAARVPNTIAPQAFGLWQIFRQEIDKLDFSKTMGGELARVDAKVRMGWPSTTVLCRHTLATLHLPRGEVVMEDSRQELRRHLPLWIHAHGRVLITGLGLGCCVRGCLANPAVKHIDVVELDPDIIRVVGAEFLGNRRVTVHQGDAVTYRFPESARWDVAWHDLHTDDQDGLQGLHAALMFEYRNRVGIQGAWGFPRSFKRIWPLPYLGRRRAA